MGYKTENNKWANKKNKQTKTHKHRKQYGGSQAEGFGGMVKSKWGQIHCDKGRFDFGWYAYTAIYKYCIRSVYLKPTWFY